MGQSYTGICSGNAQRGPALIGMRIVASLLFAAATLFSSGPLLSDPIEDPNTGSVRSEAPAITKSDARSRIEELGYQDVTDLRERDGGWFGLAKRNGRIAVVSVDAMGNILADSHHPAQ